MYQMNSFLNFKLCISHEKITKFWVITVVKLHVIVIEKTKHSEYHFACAEIHTRTPKASGGTNSEERGNLIESF